MSNQQNSGTNGAENADFHEESLQGIENVDTFAEGKRPAVSEEEMLKRKEGERKYVDPMSDFGFKRIFSNEYVMREFLNDLIRPKSPVKHVTFLDKEKFLNNDNERGVVYDLFCRTEDDETFIVEMQNRYQPFFADRIVYYLSRSIAPQGYKGYVDGKEWNFQLNPVYGVFLLNFHLMDLEPRMIRTVRFMVEETREIFNNKIRAYTIELPGIKDTKPEDCKTNIEKWVYNLYNMNTMTTPLAFQDKMPVFKKVESEAELAKMTLEEFDSYITALDNHRTYLACLEGATQEGQIKERLKNAKAMKSLGLPTETIVKVTGLSVAEIEKL